MKALVKHVLAKTPYRIVRRTALNRFQAIDDTMLSLVKRGFKPTHVVDGGAHMGSFTKSVRELFPDAVFHVVEPQPACRQVLENLIAEMPSHTILHRVALCSSELDGETVMLAADPNASSTGAHVLPSKEQRQGPSVSVRGRALDRLLERFIGPQDRIFLKLDLQGYELEALRGATRILALTEVLLTEVSFYAQAYEPPISTLMRYLSDHGFELYDVATLYARPRDNRPRQGDFVFLKRDGALAADRSWS